MLDRLLAIEVDGWAWHSDVDRFAHDRRRRNALMLAGWTVSRFTWQDLTARSISTQTRGSDLDAATGAVERGHVAAGSADFP